MERRWSQHCIQAKHLKSEKRSHFAAAIRKYGKDAFSHEVLGTFDSLEAANQAEADRIDELKTRDPEKGFNLAPGGQRTPHPIRKNPWDDPEYREKCVSASRGRASDPAWLAKVSASHVGVKLSQEHRAAIAASRVGKDHTPEVRARINGLVRETLSRPEVRSKLSESSKRAWSDPSYREKVSLAISSALKKKRAGPSYVKNSRNASKKRSDTLVLPTETETHKVCQKHGLMLKSECYERVRGDRTYLECRECYRSRNRAAYARKLAG